MHEYSIVQALVNQVEEQVRRHQARAVHAVCVQVGTLSGVDVGLLKTAYDLFREDTICARAELKVEPVEARWECRACRAELAPGGPLTCDRCGGAVRLAQGDEIVLAKLELEVA
ncbi:MAG: hydrogenase maturation nickel metallochaperone HypA [Vicinamibacteria bacterium]|nr:hydrogenase maturation nickel metallochaperone HypA [Vicinamibacteria bacterium]